MAGLTGAELVEVQGGAVGGNFIYGTLYFVPVAQVAALANATTNAVNVAASFSVVAGTYLYRVDTTLGQVVATLPASPSDGETHCIKLSKGASSVVVYGNGKNIEGATTVTLSILYSWLKLCFNATTGQWEQIT